MTKAANGEDNLAGWGMPGFCNINVWLNQKSFQGFKSEISNEEVYQMESPFPPPKTAPPKILALLAFQIELWYF